MPLDTIATEGLSLGWVIAIGFVALLIGGAIGYLLKTRNSGDKERIAELEGQLSTKEEEMTDYRAEVVTQFSQTADKFKTLDESYHALHRQLATSAVALCGDQATPLLTQSDPASAIIEGDATVETDDATVEADDATDATIVVDEAPVASDATIIVDEAPAPSDLEVSDLEITEPNVDAADAVETDSQAGTQGGEEEVAVEDVAQEVPILTEDVANDHDRGESKART